MNPEPAELPLHVRKRVDRDVTETLADAGCSGWIHATTIGSPRIGYSFDADAPVVLASVYKLALLISLCRSADRGDIDLTSSVTVDPTQWAQGPTGLAALRDPITLSRRDLATSMMTVSDNVAADVILDEIGLDRVREDLATLGVANTRIVGGVAELHQRLQRETGTSTVAEAFAALADPDDDTSVSAYDAAYSSSSTPRDCTTLLSAVWTDHAASNEMCAFIRDTMRRQVFTSRLASGFPFRRVTVAGKTGTLVAIRNEIGVVEFPGELPVAVAVFTSSARSEPALPHVDRAIGEVARTVVTELRTPAE
ncbi:MULTISPECIES: serine hydrolase [Gordonia]|uniref:Serine hydrolase n=1 Tax=Gordonia amicalis TaxID=89053 RepID=A0AAE4UC90_9ACTN|nr:MULTISPECIES: serine hydrolase [Gordonia]ATD69147.1 serine hydrolase [Gordonia sp. 1D]MBA5847594.1 serine hydrolase [Gordonia amicalis]MCZ4580837.1 class A beta-lactamase-related serine hydrolase [Gordonia amicalis]MCZ4653984.1 class A beta-lactamase-related serine hydrolase [Gordonia amicalis]MDJ0455303.1 serine hydrolase [Gordonia amicalis]